MLHIADCIERSVTLPSPPDRVWERSFGSPEALASWFPERVEGDWREGGIVILVWGEHRSEALLTKIVPGASLEYRWHPGDAYRIADLPEAELTTVRFTLTAVPEGTEVKVVESGFASLAESRAARALELNSGGWDEELQKLPKGYEG